MPIRAPRPDEIAHLVSACLPYSASGETRLRAWANTFIDAHLATWAWDGMSIEVGSHLGGTTMLFGALSEIMYGARPPPLWSVDPYGSKPYDTGHPIYTDEHYIAFKNNTRSMEYHAHFLMCSADFFLRIAGASIWRPGAECVGGMTDTRTGAQIELPMGRERRAGNAAFVLLDGEHRTESILFDLHRVIEAWIHPLGTIIIDNIEVEPQTKERVTEAIKCLNIDILIPWAVEFFDAKDVPGTWAVIKKASFM